MTRYTQILLLGGPLKMTISLCGCPATPSKLCGACTRDGLAGVERRGAADGFLACAGFCAADTVDLLDDEAERQAPLG